MAVLKTKFVDVSTTGGSSGTFWGYTTVGTVSDTANGPSDQTLDAGTVFSQSTRVTGLYYQDYITNNVYFEVQGQRANSNSSWQTHTVGSTTYARSQAGYFYNSGTNRTRWNWTVSGSSGSADNPYGTTIGADVEVSWNDTIPLGLTESLFSVSGSNSAWTTRTVDISAYAGYTARLVFHHELPTTTVGSVFLADLQLDDVRFNGTTYSFENSGQGWETTTTNALPTTAGYTGATFTALAVGTTARRWNVDTGGTPSGNTALPTADAGSYYVYTETSSPTVASDGFYLRSPATVLGSNPTLEFAEARSGSNIGTLRVYLEITGQPAGVTAPIISDVTNNNASAASVTVTVSLSNTGSGGDGLYYGRASTNNSDNVTSWQTSNTFSQSRSSNFYYFASRSADTGATNDSSSNGVLEAVPFLAPTAPSTNTVLNVAYLKSGDTSFQHSVVATGGTTITQVRTGSYTGTVVGATSGSSGTEYFTVNDAPAQNSSKTYYVTYFRPTSTGGSGSAGLTNYGTFTAYRAGDAAGTVTLDSKWIDVGTATNSGGTFYGYAYTGYGDVADTEDGTTNSSLQNIYASATDLSVADHQDFIGDSTRLAFSQSTGIILDTTKVTKVTIDGRDFALANASSFNSGVPQRGFLSWQTNLASRPFGTTTGANKLVEFKLETATGANASITNTSLSASQTVNSIVTISNASSTQKYRVIKESGSSAGGVANGASVGSRVGAGNITINNSEQPGIGETCTYQIQTSGENADANTASLFTDVTGTNNSFTITRDAVAASAPIISDVTNDNAAAPSVTVTVTLSNNGVGGTGLFYGRASTNNSDNVTTWQTSSTFSQNRGDDFYYFASRSSDTGASNTLASAGVLEEVDFLLPDRDINFTLTPGSSISAAYAGNVTVNVTDGSPNNRYRALRTTGGNLGCGNTGLIAGTTGTITIGDAANELPVSGSSFSYTLQARRGTSIGGDDVTWYTVTSSPSTFTISRGASAAPVISDVTNNNATSSSVQVTVSLSDVGSGGDGLFYGRASANNSDNVTSWQAGNTFSQSRSSNFYYFASRSSDTGATNTLASTGVLEAVPFLAPDTNISATPAVTSISSGYNSTVNVTITGMTAIDEYRLVTTDTNTPQASGHQVDFGTGVTSDTFVIAANELPDVAGTSAGYKMQARRPVADGGDNGYDDTGDSFSISRSLDTTPETYTVLAGDVTNAIPNILYYATFSSEAASNSSAGFLNLGTTIDDGTSISATNGDWGTDGLNWNSSSGTVDANDTVYYRGTSPGSSGNQTYSLRIGTVSRSFTITSSGDNLPESYSALAGSLNSVSTNKLVYATFSSASAGFTSPGTAFNVGTEVDNGTSVSASFGEWSTDGTSWTASSGTINQNQNIYYRATTASSDGIVKVHSLKIGGTSNSFATTTAGFNFWQLPGKREQALNTLVTSAIDTINGIPNNTPITVRGTGNPQIRVNSGSWTTSTTINDGDTIQARLTTANANAEMRYAEIKLEGSGVPTLLRREVWNVTTLKPAGSTEYKYRLRRSSDKFGNTSTVLQKDSSGSVPTLVTLSKGDVITISSAFGSLTFSDSSADDRFRMFGGHYGDPYPLFGDDGGWKLGAGNHSFTYLRNWGASRSSILSMGSFVALGQGFGSVPYKNTVANTLPTTSNRSVSINSQSAYATGSFSVSGLTAGIYAGFSGNILEEGKEIQWSRSAGGFPGGTVISGVQNGDTVYYRVLSPPYDNVTQTYRAFAFDSFGRNVANANEANSDFDVDVIVNPSNSAVYGMEFFDSSGSSILSVNDRSNRFAVKGSYTVTNLAAGTTDSTTINLTGMDTSDNWVINARVDLAGLTSAEYIGVNAISQSAGRFTVNTFNSGTVARTFDVDYLAILTG